MPTNIDVLIYLIKTIASWEYSWIILIPLLTFMALMFYAHWKRPIKDFLIKQDEIIIYLEKSKTEHLNFNEFDRIKTDIIIHRHRPAKIFYTLHWQKQFITLSDNEQNRNMIKQIVQKSGMKKTRNINGLDWKKENNFQTTEDDLKFDFIKKETFLSLFIVLFLGVILIVVVLYFLVK